MTGISAQLKQEASTDLDASYYVSDKYGDTINVGEEFEVTIKIFSKSGEYFWRTVRGEIIPSKKKVQLLGPPTFYVRNVGGSGAENYQRTVRARFKAIGAHLPLKGPPFCRIKIHSDGGMLNLVADHTEGLQTWIGPDVPTCPTCEGEWPQGYVHCPVCGDPLK